MMNERNEDFIVEDKKIRMKAVFMYVTDVIVYTVLIAFVLIFPDSLNPIIPAINDAMNFFHVTWAPNLFVVISLLVLLLIDTILIIPFRLLISK